MSESSIAVAQKAAAPVLSAAPSGVLQRQCACGQHATGGECERCKKKQTLLQRKSNGAGEPANAPPVVHEVLRSQGEPLPASTRAFFEPRFGQSFSNGSARRSGSPAGGVKISQPDDRFENQAESSAQAAVSGSELLTSRVNADFSHVRVHTGAKAAEATRAVGA